MMLDRSQGDDDVRQITGITGLQLQTLAHLYVTLTRTPLLFALEPVDALLTLQRQGSAYSAKVESAIKAKRC